MRRLRAQHRWWARLGVRGFVLVCVLSPLLSYAQTSLYTVIDLGATLGGAVSRSGATTVSAVGSATAPSRRGVSYARSINRSGVVVGRAGYDTGANTRALVWTLATQINLGTFGLQLAVPLFQGGAINSREREAAANYEKAKQDLENSRRTSVLSAQQSYLAVINGVAQVRALEQALISSQSALDSNKLGYEVGVRINIDVLNAQQQLFSTRRDLAVARYNTITSHLRLKAAAGSLREEDLEEVNRALQP